MSTEETDRQRNAEPFPQKVEQECAAPFQEQTAEITDPALSEGNPGAAIARTSKMERLLEEQEERRKQAEEALHKARTEFEAQLEERHADLAGARATLNEAIALGRQADKALQSAQAELDTLVEGRNKECAEVNKQLREETIKRQAAERTIDELAAEFERVQFSLQEEVARRGESERTLLRIQADIQAQVAAQTSELSKIIAALAEQLAAHEQTEDALRKRAASREILRPAAGCEPAAEQYSAAGERVEKEKRKLKTMLDSQLLAHIGELAKANAALREQIARHEQTEEALRKGTAELEARLQAAMSQLVKENDALKARVEELSKVQAVLKDEIARREKAETAFARASADLQAHLEERTSQLCTAETILREEMARREQSEDALRRAQVELQIRVEERHAELSLANEILSRQVSERERELAARRAESGARSEKLSEELSAARSLLEEERKKREQIERMHADALAYLEARMETQLAEMSGLKTALNEETVRRKQADAALREARKDFEAQLRAREEEFSKTKASLMNPISPHEKALQELHQAQRELAQGRHELERQARELTQLREVGNLLQACLTVDEVYAVIAQKTNQLFDSASGALYICHPSRHCVEAVVTWGPSPAAQRVFVPEDCWALRQGRGHQVEDMRRGLVCRHLSRPLPSAYVCAPILVQGEFRGILHLSQSSRAGLTESERRIATSTAESIALAFSNLKFREKSSNQAVRDPVTGLFNRGFMEESLTREILRATRTQNAVVVMMLEIERLNGLKKNNGDEAADALLREFSFLLQAKIRGEDIACRYSEEKFGLILPETSFEIALDRAEQIKEAMSACARDQSMGEVVISIGTSVFPDDGANCHSVLQSADSALHRAKEERLRSNDRGRVLG